MRTSIDLIAEHLNYLNSTVASVRWAMRIAGGYLASPERTRDITPEPLPEEWKP